MELLLCADGCTFFVADTFAGLNRGMRLTRGLLPFALVVDVFGRLGDCDCDCDCSSEISDRGSDRGWDTQSSESESSQA